ncbi:MAG: hypothetical protein NZ942_01395 [Candidatus Aenigmarchaeota archaeon]|nr:hypothetical protein [Candidatus Aenigmarchaeota archaeon]
MKEKRKDAVNLYKQGREFLETTAQGIAELVALDKMLYDKMQLTSYPLGEIVKQNPKATLADVLGIAYQTVKGIYEEIKKKCEEIQEPILKSVYQSYLEKITPKYLDFQFPIISLLQQDLALKIMEVEKSLEGLNKQMQKYKDEARELLKIKRDP